MLSAVVSIIAIVTFIVSIAGIYWRMNMRLNLLEKEFRMRFVELTKRIEGTEKLSLSIDKKFDIIGRNLSAILRRLNMKPQKNIFDGE